MTTAKRQFAGFIFILVPALLIWLSIAVYDKKFVKVSMVTLRTGTAGSEMHPHADVKMRGVVIGEVRDISADLDGATLKLAIQPDKVPLVPVNVSAQLLPTTLFGQRYVSLIMPDQPSPERLRAGSVIGADRSANAIEIQQVLDNLMPLLTAVQPQKLSATLTAIAQALDGRGDKIGKTFVELDHFLRRFNPSLPALNQSIRELAAFTANYSEATPDILQALNDLTHTTRTIADQRANLSTMYAAITGASDELTDFLRENSGNVIRLAVHGRPSLELLAKYSPEYPCVMRMLTQFIPKMDQVLGKGTRNPGLHVDVRTVPSTGAYRPGRDRPVFDARGGPACYPVPYTGAKPRVVSTALVNSEAENELINELIDGPDWSSVLVGPLFRGTEVRIT
ncbi:MAG: MCE family protein [Streptosporangiaceae bacterium]